MRMIDDASLATWFYCHECLLTLMSVAWGLTLDDISLEEWGQRVRFTDYYEKVVGHQFVLIPALTNTPAPQTQDPLPPVTRFPPYTWAFRPIRHVRSLLAARLARTAQVSGDSQLPILRAAWELMVELHEAPNYYPWRTLKKATNGIRQPRHQTIIRRVRAMLQVLEQNE